MFSHKMERRHDHGDHSNPVLTVVNEETAQGYWYFIAAVLGVLLLARGINFAQNTIKYVIAPRPGSAEEAVSAVSICINLMLPGSADLEMSPSAILRNHRTGLCRHGRR
jgi:hypothetical protein